MDVHDNGEPISRGQLDRRAAEARALRNALIGVALFTGVVLVNGILFILLIELLQTIGWWQVPASEGAQDAGTELSARLRGRVATAGPVASS
jgi:hypothetical protein